MGNAYLAGYPGKARETGNSPKLTGGSPSDWMINRDLSLITDA
jgi:hypothetical protein